MTTAPLLGHKLRQLRRKLQLSQAALARALDVSPSYVNLIEHNRRPVTVELLRKLSRLAGADLLPLLEQDEAHLLAELREMAEDRLFGGYRPSVEELRELVAASPGTCEGVVALYRSLQRALDENRALSERFDDGRAREGGGAAPPEEDVSDFIQAAQNHFPALEAAAEKLWRQAGLTGEDTDRRLVDDLQRRHSIRVTVVPSSEDDRAVRRFDPVARSLQLSELLPPRSRSFQLAHQIAFLDARDLLDEAVSGARFATPTARALARVALANYFAGAVLMPYAPFLAAAREVRYDIELLGHRFRTSFEQVCHRLTTLQRPGARGVPFHMTRVDIAGNVSKRFSASGIRFARSGGSCPRWNVHTAFLSPGFIRTQLSRMPDGTAYFCIARTVRKEGGGFHMPQSRLAIGLGCEVSHARELVYADGVDLGQLGAAVPIGSTCRLCERDDCRQRAFAPLQRGLEVDENVRGLSFYGSGTRSET